MKERARRKLVFMKFEQSACASATRGAASSQASVREVMVPPPRYSTYPNCSNSHSFIQSYGFTSIILIISKICPSDVTAQQFVLKPHLPLSIFSFTRSSDIQIKNQYINQINLPTLSDLGVLQKKQRRCVNYPIIYYYYKGLLY